LFTPVPVLEHVEIATFIEEAPIGVPENVTEPLGAPSFAVPLTVAVYVTAVPAP
jgi:hypothetical protein